MSPFGGRITWLGHAAFLIESPGGTRIAIDPWIGNNPKFPKGFDYGRLDVVAATHGHFDHFGDDGIALARATGAAVIGIFELALHGEAAGLARVSGMNKGGEQTIAGVRIRMGWLRMLADSASRFEVKCAADRSLRLTHSETALAPAAAAYG